MDGEPALPPDRNSNQPNIVTPESIERRDAEQPPGWRNGVCPQKHRTSERNLSRVEVRTPRQKLRRFLREWVLPIGVVVILLGSFRSAVADWNDVPTGSMKPTIVEGDRILVNKLAYDLKVPFTRWHVAEWGGPQRGDIVVCFSPANGDRLVKRVIGVPGDRMALAANRLWINGHPASYERIKSDAVDGFDAALVAGRGLAAETLGEVEHPIMLTPTARATRSFDELVVPPGRYFVMGDNRDESADSRIFGFVDRDAIVGRAWAVAYSLDRDQWYIPRLDRFLHRLR